MYVGTKDLENKGYIFVYARTLAAASLYVSKDDSRPTIKCMQITTDDKGKVSVNATDSYRLGHFESMGFALCDSPANTSLLLDWSELGKFIPGSPKASDWVALRPTKHMGQHVIEVTKLATNTSSDSVVTLGQTAYVPIREGNFPDWEVLVKDAIKDAKGASVNTTPSLNTSYLIDCFKSMTLAVSYTGAASTNIIHTGSSVKPIMLEAENEGGEYALVLLMPVRSFGSRVETEVRNAADNAAKAAANKRTKLEKENAKLKNELEALKATLAEIEAGKAA